MPPRPTIARSAGPESNKACAMGCMILFFGAFLVMGSAVTIMFVREAPGFGKLGALFPLIFVAIGVGGIWAAVRSKGLSPERVRALGFRSRKSPDIQTDLPVPKLRIYAGREYPARLSMETTQRGGIVALVFISLFWNGIVGVFVGVGLLGDQFPWWVWLFLTPFILIGIGLMMALISKILVALRVPDTVVEISQEPISPGESVQVLISQAGNLTLDDLHIEVTCEEKISYTRGTDTYREDRKVWAETVLQSGILAIRNDRPLREKLELTIPADAMHSFHASNNEIVWKLVVKGKLPRWPDFEFAFPFRVIPAGVREQIAWKRESQSV